MEGRGSFFSVLVAAMAVAFGVPQVAENLDGWGPDASSVPSQLEHVPYAPFSKGDRVGRASDWTGQAFKYNQGTDCNFLLHSCRVFLSAHDLCLVLRNNCSCSYSVASFDSV